MPSTVATFARVACRTVGAMCARVAAQNLDPGLASVPPF